MQFENASLLVVFHILDPHFMNTFKFQVQFKVLGVVLCFSHFDCIRSNFYYYYHVPLAM